MKETAMNNNLNSNRPGLLSFMIILSLTANLTVLGQGKKDPAIRAFADSLMGREQWSRIEVLRIDGTNAMDPTNLDPDGNAYYAGHFFNRIKRTNNIDEWEQEVLEQIAEEELSSTTWRIGRGSGVLIHDIKLGSKDIKIEIKEVFPPALATALGFKHSSKAALRLKFGKKDYTIGQVRQAWKRVFADSSETGLSARSQVRSRISISGAGLSAILGNGVIDFGFVPTGYEPLPAKPDDYDIAIIEPEEEPAGEYAITGLLIIASQDANIITGLFSRTRERDYAVLKWAARQLGADALMDITEKRQSGLKVYGNLITPLHVLLAYGMAGRLPDKDALGTFSVDIKRIDWTQATRYIEAKVIVYKK